MANQAESGGSAPPPRLTGHPTTRRKPPPKRRNTVPPQRASKVPSYRSNSGNRRSNAVIRRRDTGSNRTSRTPSRSAPRPTPSPTSRTINPPAPPKPVIPSVNSYLAGDSTYQRQLASYAKSLSDFMADQGLAKTDYQTNYANTRRDIGLSKTDALSDLENDFAARGLLQSSMYNQGLGDLNQQYQNQYTDLDKARTSFLDQLTQDLSKYQNEQNVGKQNARAEAIRRRAEKYS